MEKKSLSDQKALTQDMHMRNKQNKRECLQYVYLSFLVICFLCLGGFFFNRDCITIRPHVFGLSSNDLANMFEIVVYDFLH